MSTAGDTVTWLTDSAHWHGAEGVPHRLAEHLAISGLSIAIACVLALPIALALGHIRRGGSVAVNVSNASRAVPTFGLLILFAVTPIGFGNRAAVVALTLFAIPPLLTNAYVGVRDVDAEVREAARGMGMTGLQVLRRVELPLALPLIAAGLRTAAVQVVATATLAAYVGGGGLGRFIADGFGQADPAMTTAGGVLVAALALLVELSLGALQRRLTPGPRRRRVLPGLDPSLVTPSA
ncbi:MAG: osmoprotectant transport system permease protein [Actinomycetota bacterium]|jgi:osmoprotectant transport system permease protein|nr:osmoprotectant transport system permease protein [Actinomycetota bacterium]